MKDIKHLDESITQYEEMHARQDLQAFKELLAATKSLLAEHSSRDRSMGSYQVGDFLQLSSINRFMLAAQQSAIYLNEHMPQIQAAQEREQLRVESIYAEERGKQGAMDLVFGILTFVVGGAALFMSGGTMWPIVTFAFKSGALALSLSGGSNSIEAGWNIYYGLSGDGKSFAMNPIRDTLFLGNGELYHSVGQVFTLTTGVFIPIAQTKSIAQGISQFFWGTVGSIATGQAAYHGTKLLGGNEETAQLMNLLGNFVGGYSAAKAVENFSLNGKTVPKVSPEKVQIQEPELLKSSIKTMSDEVYTEYRKMSIKNPESDTMTLGKYEPTIRPDGSKDYRTPGSGSYNVLAEADGSSYFDMGKFWNEIQEEHNLNNWQMFEAFNKQALDDAVAQGKTIRFSHDPTLDKYKNSALRWEWDYLQEQHGYKDLDLIGDYWYANK